MILSLSRDGLQINEVSKASVKLLTWGKYLEVRHQMTTISLIKKAMKDEPRLCSHAI